MWPPPVRRGDDEVGADVVLSERLNKIKILEFDRKEETFYSIVEIPIFIPQILVSEMSHPRLYFILLS